MGTEKVLPQYAGRAYEIGVFCGFIKAVKSLNQEQKARYRLGPDLTQIEPLHFIHQKLLPHFNCTHIQEELLRNISPASVVNETAYKNILIDKLWAGYSQGYLETRNLIVSLIDQYKSNKTHLEWVYADADFIVDILTEKKPSNNYVNVIQQSFSQIGKNYENSNIFLKGDKSKSDLIFILSFSKSRTNTNNNLKYCIICYEMSSHLYNDEIISEGDQKGFILSSADNDVLIQNKYINFRSFNVGKIGNNYFHISNDLKNHITRLIKVNSRNIRKTVQAGSYVYSFFNWLNDLNDTSLTEKGKRFKSAFHKNLFHGILCPFLSIKRDFLHIDNCKDNEMLKTMHKVYKGSGRAPEKDPDIIRKELESSIHSRYIKDEYLGKIIKMLKYKVTKERQKGIDYQDYENGKIPSDIFRYEYTNFCNTNGCLDKTRFLELAKKIDDEIIIDNNTVNECVKNLQKAHSFLVSKSISLYDICILCGCPGIGKTTSYFLYQAEEKKKTVSFYFSPRILVNRDFIKKPEGIIQDDFISLTTDWNLINGGKNWRDGKPVAVYVKPNNKNINIQSRYAFVPIDDDKSLNEIHEKVVKGNAGNISLEKVSDSEGIGKSSTGKDSVLGSAFKMTKDLLDSGESKIFFSCSIQSNTFRKEGEGALRNSFLKLFNIKDKNDLDSNKIKSVASKIDEIHFFVDEITGDSGGKGVAIDCLSIKKDVEDQWSRCIQDENQPCPLKIKVIIADANIVNAESIDILLNNKKNTESQIVYNSRMDNEYLNVESMNIKTAPIIKGKKDNAIVINANAYPASRLTFEYKPVVKIYDSEPNKKNLINHSKNLYENSLLDQIAVRILTHLEEDKNSQVLVIIQQNKEYVDLLKRILQEKQKDISVFCLHSNISNEQKNTIFDSITNDERKTKNHAIIHPEKRGDLYDVVIMTSSGTRGIDFPMATRIICVIPSFHMENNLAEYVQGIYRSRGGYRGTSNKAPKTIEFVIPQVLCKNVSESYFHQSVNNISTALLLTRLCIDTRISGAAYFKKRYWSFIPLPETYLKSQEKNFYINLIENYKSLMKSTRIDYIHKKNLQPCFENLLSNLHRTIHIDSKNKLGETLLSDSIRRNIYSSFAKDVCDALSFTVNKDYIPSTCHTCNSMIMQKLDNKLIEKTSSNIFTEQQNNVKKIISTLYSMLNTYNEINDKRCISNLLDIFNKIKSEKDINFSILSRSQTRNVYTSFLLGTLLYGDFFDNFDSEDKDNAYGTISSASQVMFPDLKAEYPISGSSYKTNDPVYLYFMSTNGDIKMNNKYNAKYFTTLPDLCLFNILLLSEDEID